MQSSKRAQHTAISTSDSKTIVVRGRDLCQDLIGKINFIDYYYLMLTGSDPTPQQTVLLNAVLVALADHGLTPSVQAARMTLDAAPEALQGAVAAGVLGCGSVVLGSSAAAGEFLQSIVRTAETSGSPLEAVAGQRLTELRERRASVPGYGHSWHRDGDPRVTRLVQIAREQGAAGSHVEALLLTEKLIPEVFGRTLVANVSGAIPAVMLDCGFPLEALKGISILARTAGILAHLHEEMTRPIGFTMAQAAMDAIAYDGERPAGLRTEGQA